MDLSALRLLIAQAREDDGQVRVTNLLVSSCAEPEPAHRETWEPVTICDAKERALEREPVLARALEAALEVVEAAKGVDRIYGGSFQREALLKNVISDIHTPTGPPFEALRSALSRFRAAVEKEA